MLKIRKKYRKIKGLLITTFCFTVPTPYFLKMIICIQHLGTLGISWVGVDSVTFPFNGATGDQYDENTSKI